MNADHSSRSRWHKSTYSANSANCLECSSATWIKSSHSTNGGDCVECASASWAKSSRSGAHGENCLEYAPLSTSIAVRDSKHPQAGHLDFPGGGWSAFLGALKYDALDV